MVCVQLYVRADCSDELYGVMLQCWDDERESRPSFKRLLSQMRALAAKASTAPIEKTKKGRASVSQTTNQQQQQQQQQHGSGTATTEAPGAQDDSTMRVRQTLGRQTSGELKDAYVDIAARDAVCAFACVCVVYVCPHDS